MGNRAPLIFKGSVAQPETLPHHMRRHPETGGDLFRAKAALFRELLERLELVGGMLVFQGDVLVKAEFVRGVRGGDDATDRLGLLHLPPPHPQKLRNSLPSPILPKQNPLPTPPPPSTPS